MVDMADIATPTREPPALQANFTRPLDFESPHQQNIRTSKRQQREPTRQAPPLQALNLGGGAANSNHVSTGIHQRVDTLEEEH